MFDGLGKEGASSPPSRSFWWVDLWAIVSVLFLGAMVFPSIPYGDTYLIDYLDEQGILWFEITGWLYFYAFFPSALIAPLQIGAAVWVGYRIDTSEDERGEGSTAPKRTAYVLGAIAAMNLLYGFWWVWALWMNMLSI